MSMTLPLRSAIRPVISAKTRERLRPTADTMTWEPERASATGKGAAATKGAAAADATGAAAAEPRRRMGHTLSRAEKGGSNDKKRNETDGYSGGQTHTEGREIRHDQVMAEDRYGEKAQEQARTARNIEDPG